MALETVYRNLRSKLNGLLDVFSALQVTVAEDKPLNHGAAAADALEDQLTEIVGALEEALAAADEVSQGVKPPCNFDQARLGLATVQACINRVLCAVISQLASYDHIHALKQLARERGREWTLWAGEVKTNIDRCVMPMNAVLDTLLECWQELAERIGMSSVSVHATNIGQQISVREDQVELAGKAT